MYTNQKGIKEQFKKGSEKSGPLAASAHAGLWLRSFCSGCSCLFPRSVLSGLDAFGFALYCCCVLASRLGLGCSCLLPSCVLPASVSTSLFLLGFFGCSVATIPSLLFLGASL